ncbi:hypothetical protein AK812_SmicGene1513 [Symbiodinium microadriaticum]|uniref:Uncharacterized protein n=1 Tax=Symbiodinium microadriaticum TaxID=2951 RepID=A0A1Q9F3X2_SYMMI|nr:hypothetical protein AK812_SmicGene1513 [Symbiodinium microadriaticum]
MASMEAEEDPGTERSTLVDLPPADCEEVPKRYLLSSKWARRVAAASALALVALVLLPWACAIDTGSLRFVEGVGPRAWQVLRSELTTSKELQTVGLAHISRAAGDVLCVIDVAQARLHGDSPMRLALARGDGQEELAEAKQALYEERGVAHGIGGARRRHLRYGKGETEAPTCQIQRDSADEATALWDSLADDAALEAEDDIDTEVSLPLATGWVLTTGSFVKFVTVACDYDRIRRVNKREVLNDEKERCTVGVLGILLSLELFMGVTASSVSTCSGSLNVPSNCAANIGAFTVPVLRQWPRQRCLL